MCLNFSTENITPLPLDKKVEKMLQHSKKENFQKIKKLIFQIN